MRKTILYGASYFSGQELIVCRELSESVKSMRQPSQPRNKQAGPLSISPSPFTDEAASGAPSTSGLLDNAETELGVFKQLLVVKVVVGDTGGGAPGLLTN